LNHRELVEENTTWKNVSPRGKLLFGFGIMAYLQLRSRNRLGLDRLHSYSSVIIDDGLRTA
jgi:hypothetical protein